MDDRQLLKQFTQHNSQQAFAALTARYLRLVYSTCRRELDDASLAEDVTQAVFLILARKAPSLRREVVLSGWLFQTARFAARNAHLQETRRKAYEQTAADTMKEHQMETEDAAWTEIEPLLNQSLAALRDGERQCVLLRFFQQMTFAEAGTALGLSEDAARKRVTRALDKMRQVFVKNGVIVPSTALAVLMTAHAAKAAPISCAAGVSRLATTVLAGHLPAALAGTPIYQFSQGALHTMKIVQAKAVVSLTTAAMVGASAYLVATRVLSLSHAPVPMSIVSNPGHVLHQIPGKTLTAARIAARCREAYSALQSYQGTTTVTAQGQTLGSSQLNEYHTTAEVTFVHPGKISVTGQDSSGYALAYISNGTETEETFEGNNNWKKATNLEASVAGMTGIGFSAPTTIPGMLIGMKWGMPAPLIQKPDPAVREDQADGQLCYVLTASVNQTARVNTPAIGETGLVWIDEKTFRLRRAVTDRSVGPQTTQLDGNPHLVPAGRIHLDQGFTNERIDQPVPSSTFTLPTVQ